MTTYALLQDGKSAIRSSDGACVPWDATNNQPLDISGLAGRVWIADGSPAPLAPAAAVVTAATVKAECQRRTYAVMSDSAQKNMMANAVAGNLTADEMAAWKEGVAWISSMQTVCRTLIAAADSTYTEDAHWPPAPAAATALARQY
jgi:hypothetical protein